MSKNLIRIEPDQIWRQRQQDLQQRQQQWDAQNRLFREGLGPKPGTDPPRNWNDPATGKSSRWLQCKSFSNYDESRFGPDPIDSVIDRLGRFEGLDFASDIRFAEENNFGPTTLIDRTGTPEFRDEESAHYPNTMVNDAEKIGIDLDRFPMFDSSRGGIDCLRIADFVGLDFQAAQQGAQRDYGYDSFHIQRPGQMLMMHHDLYYAIIRDHDPELAWRPEKLRRIVIFMEDWRPGHIWIAGNTHYSHWRAGDVITWSWVDMPHGTANLSAHNRYSLHLTGYMTERSWNFYQRGHADMRYVPRPDGGFDAYVDDGRGNRTWVYSA